MTAQQGGQQGDDKNSMAILWIIAGVFFVGAFIWWGFAEELKYFFIQVRVFELTGLYWLCKWLPFDIFANITKEIGQNLDIAKALTPGNISLDLAEYLSVFVGKFYRWPISIALVIFAYLMYVRNIKMRYKKRYDMKKLVVQERNEWPQIRPILDVDLLEQDLDEGPWAMAMPPMLFCRANKLINVKAKLPEPGALVREPQFIVELDKARAEQVFAQQLGRMWRGPESLPMHRRALLATFMARAVRDGKSSNALLRQINLSAGNKRKQELDFEGVDELWKKYYNRREIQEVVQRHAYESSLFMSLLLLARKDGVFPTADFLWLKSRDRRFWYILSNVGRQIAFCEAAGVQAHFLAEKALGRSLSVPMVTEAVKGLQFALKELIYKPTPEEKEELLQAAQAAGG